MNRARADMLAARLRWPAPRIRWEAATSIAGLIREGNRDMRQGLIDWIDRRTLESEVIIGLGVIDAFRLAEHFDIAALYTAIRAPSVLSDWMLARNFGDIDGLDGSRHAFAPDVEVKLSPQLAASFDRHRKFAVPPIFASTLASLERRTGLALTARWEHEWRWLQSLERLPIGEYPEYFFSGSNKGEIGPFDGAQREVFASAYLRVLHWAERVHNVPRKALELQSLIALTMNRGLADIGPVRRPRWAHITLPAVADPAIEARRIWDKASAGLPPAERLISLNLAETCETSFAEYRFRLVAVPRNSTLDDEDGPVEYGAITLVDEPGSFSGGAATHADFGDVTIDRPVELAQKVSPYGFGRVHIDLFADIAILSPLLAGEGLTVDPRGGEVRACIGRRIASRWRYWYAGWSPAHPVNLQTRAPSLATARSDLLDRIAERHNVGFGIWVDIQRGTRETSYREMEVTSEGLWLMHPASPPTRRKR